MKIGPNHFSRTILFSPLLEDIPQCATTHEKLAQNRHLLYSQLLSTLLASTSTHETGGASSMLNWEPTLEHSDQAILLSDMHTSLRLNISKCQLCQRTHNCSREVPIVPPIKGNIYIYQGTSTYTKEQPNAPNSHKSHLKLEQHKVIKVEMFYQNDV